MESSDVNEAKARLKRTRGAGIANRAFAALRTMMNWAVSEAIIRTAPTVGLKNRRPRSRESTPCEGMIRPASFHCERAHEHYNTHPREAKQNYIAQMGEPLGPYLPCQRYMA